MIARLRGRASGRVGQALIVDVNGVGYLVHATPSVHRLGADEITVEVHTVVREDALQLFGFASADERELFELLLGVNGVGPKVALAIVSGSTPAELRRAIARDDVKRFQAIPGVGLKTAQRVVLELKAKLADASFASGERSYCHGTRWWSLAGPCSTRSARSPTSTSPCRSRSRSGTP